MERGQFTFYSSFATAISRIRKKADRCDAYDALVQYALTGELPDLEALPDVVAMFMEMAIPTLDASKRKAENGKAGRRGKQTEAKEDFASDEVVQTEKANGKQTESKQKQTESKRKQTDNKKEKEIEGEIEIKKENECYIPSPSPRRTVSTIVQEATAGWTPELQDSVRDWIAYKKEKRQGYQETGLRSLLSQIRKAADTYGDQAVIEIIQTSMSSNYTGIVFDRLASGRGAAKTGTAAELEDSYRMIKEWANG